MTYEEEQLKYAEELKTITSELRGLEDLFFDPSLVDEKVWELYKQMNPLEEKYQLSSSQYEKQKKIHRFKLLLESDYHKKRSRKQELERLLSQSQAERTKDNVKNGLGKTAEFMASITPQHVSGRVYRIENGSGCGTFCLWFLIIDAIIVFIIYLCTK
jgi:hypothetical protein